jgi:hypothetical protein
VLYYVLYVRHVQCFSPEEQEKFMKVYILNANRIRRRATFIKSGMWHSVRDMYRFRIHRTNSVSNSFSDSNSNNNESTRVSIGRAAPTISSTSSRIIVEEIFWYSSFMLPLYLRRFVLKLGDWCTIWLLFNVIFILFTVFAYTFCFVIFIAHYILCIFYY